jgi:hypothetical protein
MTTWLSLWLWFACACGAEARMIAPMPREQAVLDVLALARLDRIEPEAVAAALGTRVTATEQVTPVRREYRLAPTAAFAEIELIAANDWRVVTVAPAAALDLALQDLQPHVLDARHATEMQPVHTPAGFGIGAMLHRFAIGARELVVDVAAAPRGRTAREATEQAVRDGLDQAAAGPRRDPVRRLIVTTDARIPANAPTLRDFRAWAK